MRSAPVLVSGGTGLVGGRLLPALIARGAHLRVLSRRPERLAGRGQLEAVGWDGRQVPASALAGAKAAIHLAGEPLFGGLPTESRLARVCSSRIASTRSLVIALGELPRSERPELLVCASAIGFYGDRGEEDLTEEAPAGSGFLAELCRDWEQEAQRAEEHGVRSVSLRIGVVLAREAGALALMGRLFRLGLGGRLGSGRQWFSWIHADDLVALILTSLDTPDLHGTLNAVAPHPVRNRELTAALGRILARPTWLPAPAFVLRAAMGELSGELLASRRVLPTRAQKLGFQWEHPTIDSALSSELRAG
jgi:uncharacterized protein (TIGR01777 family)